MNHYLWGVFKPREVEAKQGAALHDPDHTTGATTFASDAISTVPPGSAVAATVSASIPTEHTTEAGAVVASATHGQDGSSGLGAPAGRMVAIVVRQTPRLEPLIREICKDGALVMHGEITNWQDLAK
ncbi:hypothetical protein U9M48_010447 [Paspalum notatum var. saurae]|uniref:Uncharacterized protein n=1 Tax=Paspalum notatum var. saurae TaxID=547442 RepID=A0AAQ3STQ0_PASNO